MVEKRKNTTLKVVKGGKKMFNEVHFSPDTEVGAALLKQIKSVDNGGKFLSSEDFIAKYSYLAKG